MIEATKIEIRILYDNTQSSRTDAVLMTRTYQALGFSIIESELPKNGNKGYYIMQLECEGLNHPVFALNEKSSYPGFFKKLEKNKPLG